MTDQRQRFAQQFPTPQRTQVLPQQAWQPAAPPHGGWQQAQHWPHGPQQSPQHWPPQQWPQQQWQWQPAAPATSGPSSEEKNGALGAFLGAFFMPVLLPLLVMLTATNKPFQRAAALQALIVQLGSFALYLCVPFVMLLFVGRGLSAGLMYIYVPILMIGLFSLGFAILGMSAAQQGKIQYAPLIGRRLAKTFRAEWAG